MVMCWEKDKRAPTRPSASKAVRECIRAGRVRVNRKRVREVPRSQFWSVQPLRRVSSSSLLKSKPPSASRATEWLIKVLPMACLKEEGWRRVGARRSEMVR